MACPFGAPPHRQLEPEEAVGRNVAWELKKEGGYHMAPRSNARLVRRSRVCRHERTRNRKVSGRQFPTPSARVPVIHSGARHGRVAAPSRGAPSLLPATACPRSL